jgi:hypothetical protein
MLEASEATVMKVVAKKPVGFLVFDIESTGANVFTNRIFAIGWAYGSCPDDVVGGKILIDLGKPKDVSWEAFWDQCGWEKRCWDEFWSKNVSTLDALQSWDGDDIPHSDSSAAFSVSAVMQEVEDLFDRYTIVTDTIAFDTVWLTNLLYDNGFHGLAYRRDGNYNRGIGGIEVDSYLMGVYGVQLEDENDRKTKPWTGDPLYKSTIRPPHDHDPKNDAHHILCSLFDALNANKRFKLIENRVKATIVEKEEIERRLFKKQKRTDGSSNDDDVLQ